MGTACFCIIKRNSQKLKLISKVFNDDDLFDILNAKLISFQKKDLKVFPNLFVNIIHHWSLIFWMVEIENKNKTFQTVSLSVESFRIFRSFIKNEMNYFIWIEEKRINHFTIPHFPHLSLFPLPLFPVPISSSLFFTESPFS